MTTLDQWSGADHKDLEALDFVPPYVVNEDDVRRLRFYAAAQAYIESVARLMLPDNEDSVHKASDVQEFGDPAVLVERIAYAVLGESPSVGIVGADQPLTSSPNILPAPEAPDEGLEETERRVAEAAYQAVLAVWEEESLAEIDNWIETRQAIARLLGRQDWLENWDRADRFLAKLKELESEHVVGLGDGVAVFGWDPLLRRPKTEIFEPSAYFPVLDDAEPSEFPKKVHLAWDFVTIEGEGDNAEEVKWVRRVTYELVPLTEFEGPEPPAPLYHGDGDVFSEVCLLSDGVWRFDDFERVHDLPKRPAFWNVQVDPVTGEEVELVDMVTGYDFIPVLHVPNTGSSSRHFGRSVLVRLMQLLDEIAASDTDESLASRWAARPPPVISGLLPAADGSNEVNMSPGRGVRVSEGGRVTTVDMAANLGQIGERLTQLLKRLAVNSKVPEGLLGRVDASEVPSGLALTLSFTPFEQLIEDLREIRKVKYSLALKWVQRIAIQNGDETLDGSTEVLDAEVRFGAFMPQDLVGITEIVARLVAAKMMSQETGIAFLASAGVPYDDFEAEVQAIRATDGDTALAIAEALQSSAAAAAFLGVRDFEEPAAVDPDGSVGAVPELGG